MQSRHRWLAVLFAVFAGVWLAAAQERPTSVSTTALTRADFMSLEDVVEGKRLVRAYCSRCHGKDGTGAKGPDLTRGVFRHGSSDEAIFRNMHDGIRGTGMPGLVLPDDWAWRIISYMRASAAARNNQEKLTGDPVNGQKLFVKHKCDSCHWTGASGGRRGSDLSKRHGTAEHARKAIMQPTEEIDPLYQPLVVVMNDGTVLNGMRIYESTFDLLLIDDTEQWLAIPKSEIEQINRATESLMPSYGKELSAKDVEDLVAYIFSLQKEPAK